MREETPSGESDTDVEPSGLVEMLAGEPAAAAVLALCSAERLSVIAERLVRSPLARSAVRTGLDLSWSAVVGSHGGTGDELGKAISDLDELFDSERADVPEFQSELNHAMCSASYALRAVREGDRTAAANAVSYCRDQYFQLAVRAWPRLDLRALIASPVVQGEVRREVSEARAIAAWDGAIPAERVESLRQAAHADGEILAKLIRGGLGEADEGSASGSGQESLF